MVRLKECSQRWLCGKAGLSLIGVLVATFVLLTGVLVAMRVIALTRHTVGISREEFEATNLAREGLELVYAQRDYSRGQVEAGLVDNSAEDIWSGICTGPGTSTFLIEPPSSDGSGPGILSDQPARRPLRYGAEGILRHTNSGEKTIYSRVIEADCSHAFSNDSAEYNPFHRQYYVDVTSTVTWSSRGQNKTVDIKARIFDWRTRQQSPESNPTSS